MQVFAYQSQLAAHQNVFSRLRAILKSSATWLVPMAGASALLLAPTFAQAAELPQGGSVAAGSASISSPHNGTLDINQSSNRAIINWHSFSVGQGGTVNFHQPGASSATLNRVTGNTPSSIAGSINAPGTVLLVNPNGIAITKDGVINTGSFAASTLDIKNSDFMSGNYKFTGNGNSQAVTNAGHINVSDGGFAALLGGHVANDGVITARLGHVALGSGELVTLDLSGDGFLSVAVPTKDLGKLKSADGKPLVSNKGQIVADGGVVSLKAATAAGILRDAVNVPGSIQANSVGLRNGKIVLGGGVGGRVRVAGNLTVRGGKNSDGGKVKVSGAEVTISGKIAASGRVGGDVRLAASHSTNVSGAVSAKGTSGQGGWIDLSGANVQLVSAQIDASGATGGGLIRIGGTFQGGHGDPTSALYQSYIGRFGALPDLAAAQTVAIDAGSTLNVSAADFGDAGTAVVWSSDNTQFAGSIIGNGGPNGGNGGYAEVSSHNVLDFTGTADLAASVGATGTLLLDPRSITISNGSDSDNNLCASDTCSPTGSNSVLYVGTLLSALASADVIVDTAHAGGSGSGTITVDHNVNDYNGGEGLQWTSGHSLTLDAAGDIDVYGDITSKPTSGAGNITLISGGAVSLGGEVGSTRYYSTISTNGTNGSITVQADSLSLYSHSVVEQVKKWIPGEPRTVTILYNASLQATGTGGTVTIVPATTAGSIMVGGGPSGADLNLSTGALKFITASMLQIGDSSSGELTVAGTLSSGSGNALANIGNLTLESGSSIAVNSAIALTGVDGNLFSSGGSRNGGTAGDLTLSGGSLTIDAAISSAGGSGSFGVGGDGGAISLTSNGGDISINDAISSTGGGGGSAVHGGRNGGDGGAISLTSNGGGISINEAISSTGGIGGDGGFSRGGNGGDGGTISLTTGNGGDILADAEISSAGGTGGAGVDRGSGGDGGAVSLTTGNGGDILIGAEISSAGGAGNAVTVVSGRDLTIAGAQPGGKKSGGTSGGQLSSAKTNGTSVVLAAARNFVNNEGSDAISVAGTARWLVYSHDPAGDTFGGLGYDFEQYNAPYATAPAQATGNGFLFTLAPTITVGLTGVTKVYDGNRDATLAADNYKIEGVAGNDVVTLSGISTSGTYATKNVGSNIQVAVSNPSFTLSVTSQTGKSVYGYQVDHTLSPSTGAITPATLTISAVTDSKVYNGTPSSKGIPLVVSGLVRGDR